MTESAPTLTAADAEVVSRWIATHGDALATTAVAPPRLPDNVRAAEIVGVAMGFRVGHESLYPSTALVRSRSSPRTR